MFASQSHTASRSVRKSFTHSFEPVGNADQIDGHLGVATDIAFSFDGFAKQQDAVRTFSALSKSRKRIR